MGTCCYEKGNDDKREREKTESVAKLGERRLYNAGQKADQDEEFIP